MVSDESRARRREGPTGFPGTGALIWTPLCCRGDARWWVGLLDRRRGSWGSEASLTPLVETSRRKDDLDEVGERKKVDGLHGVTAQLPSSPRARSGGLRGAREWWSGDRRLLKRGQTHPPPGSYRRPWSQEHYTWASRLMGCSPDDGRLSRTSRICPPAPSTRGGCSTTGRRRPFCLHSRRAGSSARLLADEAAVHEGDGRMHIEGIRGLVREWPDSLFKDVSSSCRYPGGGGHAEGTGEAGDAQPAPRPGPPIPDRAVGRSSERWSGRHYLCEPGALDDAFCEDEMIDRCVVCLSRQKDAVILPCRHLVVCEVCADQIEHCCPYCRGKADEALVVEYPEWPDA
ncbi:Zinc finger, C3HC4 type (RING finger) domain-containing protein [Giardia muris]|uniref:Zinc finger, C3HC4 type (RING finger) domain-containing protein n=1 Tax=Giardia muris TaxID=5742 RepID=A0A4Z1ST18_GIAMU|nr:Zinc finger, C3HC4 type (RING finger) domain-containing protein [Giardia muris]|eukprot:TNJ29082.1 Zinc finger, C3HC4 type (RING finger) domain-containing protein [Giardia muris]